MEEVDGWRIRRGCGGIAGIGGKLNDLLKIRTLPIGMKQFESLEALSKNGRRYPIPPYGAHMVPSERMGKSYS
jgi:hypothetical protein